MKEQLLTCLERGEANTRDRDWADIWRLSRGNVIEGKPLRMAIEATGRYRGVKPEPVGERIGISFAVANIPTVFGVPGKALK